MDTLISQLTVGQAVAILGELTGVVMVYGVMMYIIANLILDMIYAFGDLVAHFVKKLFVKKNKAVDIDMESDFA